jgi:hypothetical protein
VLYTLHPLLVHQLSWCMPPLSSGGMPISDDKHQVQLIVVRNGSGQGAMGRTCSRPGAVLSFQP